MKDWKEIIGSKSHKEDLARKFKDNLDPMKIAIIVDMWLTGFDVPSLATMAQCELWTDNNDMAS